MHHRAISRYWLPAALAMALVLAAGAAGFREHFLLIGEPKPWLDVIYLSGQLFIGESGAVDGPVPWQLQAARFLAPLVAASALVAAYLSLFSGGTRRWMLRFGPGHYIVCGLGRTGARLVEELRSDGVRVAVIEPDEHNPGLARCRALKVAVIHGRSDDSSVLSRAFAGRASMIIATAGTDTVNIETAVLAHDFARDRGSGPLRCVAHLSDPFLQQMLKAHPVFADQSDPFELELVNVYEAGARHMLDRAELRMTPRGDQALRLCILGLGQFGDAVLRRALRDWSVQRNSLSGDGGAAASPRSRLPGRLEIVIVDLAASAMETSARQRYREYLDEVDLRFIDRDVRSPEFAGPHLAVTRPDQEVDVFFVCFDDDTLAAIAAFRIRDRFPRSGPVIVRMTAQTGLSRLLRRDSGGCGTVDGICPVGFLEIACMKDLFLGGDNEILARAFHEDYLEDGRAAGDKPESNSNLVPWHELDKPAREQNRRRAADTREQLSRIGLSLVPCPGRPVELYRLSPEQVEPLARIEHARWLEQKRADGWNHGSERDPKRKLHPSMVPWEKLGEGDKEMNRATVRRLPAIVARADFEIRAAACPDGGASSGDA